MALASELPKLYQGVQKQSFGYKMLSTMGWKEGQGLGANNQGIKEHIKVKKKQDAFGVGAAEQAHKLRDWTTGMVGYDAILSGLKEISRGAAAGGSSSSSDDTTSTNSSQGHSSGYDSDSGTSSDAAARAAAAKKSKETAVAKKSEKGKKRKKCEESEAADTGKDSSKKKRKQLDKSDTAAAAAAAGKPDKRAKKGKAAASSDSSSSSDSEAEPAAAAVAAAAVLGSVSRVKAATHLGRYAKRERAKTVRNYSATDLAAILGLPSSAPTVEGGEGADAWAAAAAAAGSNARQAVASSSSGSDDDDSSSSDTSSDSRGGSEQRLRPGTPPGSDTPPGRAQQGFDDAAKPFGSLSDMQGAAGADGTDADSKAWWRSVFVKSGGSGSSLGMRPAAAAAGKSINAHGFLEDDQTNLYMQAHAAATTGKQGLGRSSMPKKVAGARWQGTKTKLGSDNEDEGQETQQQQEQHDAAVESIAAAAAAAGREQYVKNGILIVLPVKRQPAAAAAAAAGQQQQQEQQRGSKAEKKSKKKQAAAAAEAVPTDQEQGAAAAPESKKRKQQQAAVAGSSKKSKKQSGQQEATADQPTAAAAAGGASKSVKWAKLAAKILEGAPKRRMRIQKLHKKVVAAAGYDVDAPGVDTEVLYQQMLKKLRKAEGLAVCEKYVGLSVACEGAAA